MMWVKRGERGGHTLHLSPIKERKNGEETKGGLPLPLSLPPISFFCFSNSIQSKSPHVIIV